LGAAGGQGTIAIASQLNVIQMTTHRATFSDLSGQVTHMAPLTRGIQPGAADVHSARVLQWHEATSLIGTKVSLDPSEAVRTTVRCE
jgi:hypothetical protein